MRSLSLAELQAYNSFTKTELFHRVMQNICFDIKDHFVEQLFVAASERRQFKDTHSEKEPSNKTPALTKSMNMDI